MDIKIGSQADRELIVATSHTAKALDSGAISVFATPAMIALMEGAAMDALQNQLSKGFSSVGTVVQIKHLAATPVGMKITAHAEIIEVDRKRVTFKVTAYDDKELIGEGIHERFIIEEQKFIEKVSSKAN